jgi:hypothetical protein
MEPGQYLRSTWACCESVQANVLSLRASGGAFEARDHRGQSALVKVLSSSRKAISSCVLEVRSLSRASAAIP